MEDVKLIDLIDKEALQRIQDGFSKYTGMAAITVDVNGLPITADSGFTRFCNELTRKSELGCKNCEKCDRDGAFRTLEEGKASAYVCHAGLMDFAAPIIVEGEVIGGFIGGQVRIREIDEEDMIKKAIEYGIDPEEYVKASYETSLLTREAVEKAATFIEEIASALSVMAYKSYLELKESDRMGRVAKSQADYVMNMSMNLEHVMDRWTQIINHTMQETSDQDVRSLLSSMQNDSKAIKGSLDETIHYIKTSADEIEISESEYTVMQLVQMLSEAEKSGVQIKVLKTDHEKLFGDVVRIGQMLNKTMKAIAVNKKGGSLEIQFSTKQKQYATYLNIVIIDSETIYTGEEIETIRRYFNQDVAEAYDHDDERGIWLSLEGELLRNMSGTIEMFRRDRDFVIEVNIPQIGL